jgi:hypothetical protein
MLSKLASHQTIAAAENNFPVPQKIFPVIGGREFLGNGCGSGLSSVGNRVGKLEITIFPVVFPDSREFRC